MKIKFLQANNGDCILITFQDSDDVTRNILIDGGMPQTYYNSGTNTYGELFDTIQSIKNNKGEKIDLLILTHIDEDHIGGILKWIESDKEANKIIRTVWFNSGKTIANYFSDKENEDLKILLKIPATNETSVPQGKIFEDYIESNEIWNKAIIKFGTDIDFYGAKMEVLSPNDLLLKKLLKEYRRPIYNYFTANSEVDWSNDIVKFIEEEDKLNFRITKDKSVSNGSSIAFILTFKEKKFLFLGDSFPEVIVHSLNQMGYNESNKLKVELMKISHHGSCKNTTNELLKIIATNNYIISTSSESHNHPDKRTISRILNNNSNATVYFNYDLVRKSIFSEKDFKDFPNLYAKNVLDYNT